MKICAGLSVTHFSFWSKRIALSLPVTLVIAAWLLPSSMRVKGAAGVTEAVWSSFYVPPLSGAGSAGLSAFVPATSHTLTRFLVTAESAPYQCNPNAIVAVKDITTNTILTSLTITGTFQDSGPLSVAMSGGHKFRFVATQGAKNCTNIDGVPAVPAWVDISAIYK